MSGHFQSDRSKVEVNTLDHSVFEKKVSNVFGARGLSRDSALMSIKGNLNQLRQK